MIKRNKYIIIFTVIFIICFILFQNYKNTLDKNKKDKITIACGNDASGMLFDYIINSKESNIEFSNLDYIQFLDCCGSQAEFAFISGKVDMAVLCPDAAFQLMSVDTNYYIVDSIVNGSNILVYYDESYDDIEPKDIGYMNKRLLQEALLKERYKNSNYYPMLATALPYALEKKTVDAIFIDIILALKIKNARFKKIDTEKTDYYLVASKKLKDTVMLNDFIKVYNEAIDDIDNETVLSNVLADYLDISNSEGEMNIWKTMGVRFHKIKAE